MADASSLRALLVAGRATGGTRSHVAGLARHLADRGAAVTVLAAPVVLDPLREAPDRTITLAALPVDRAGSPSLLAIRAAVRRHRDARVLVHAHGLQASLGAATAGGRPIITTWHNAALDTGPRLAAHRAAERLVAARSDLVLAVSPDLAERARAAGARDVRTIEVPAPGLPPATRTREQTRKALGIAADRPVVLAAGRLERQKRLGLLVDVAARWGAEHEPLVLIAGDGSLRADLDARIRALRAPVRLLGWRGDITDLLAAADVAVLTSVWEGWPLFAQEALRAGVPLVASDIAGTRALARDGAAFVAGADPAEWRSVIERAAADPTLRGRLVRAGRHRAEQWLTIDEANDRIVAMMLEINSRLRPRT